MFPGYPASDMRVEIIEGELYIDEIKANQRRIGPLACCINGPHANPTTKIQNAFRWIIGCNHHRRPAVEEAAPQVMVHSIAVKEVPVIGNWIGRLSWRVIVVFVTTLVYKLVLFSPGLCRGKGGTNAHVKKSLGGIANIEGYEASRSWDEEDEGIKRVEIVWKPCRKEAYLWCGWNGTTVGQNHTIAHDNKTTFSSERASFVLSLNPPTTWVITDSSAFVYSINNTPLRPSPRQRCNDSQFHFNLINCPIGRTMMRLRWRQYSNVRLSQPGVLHPFLILCPQSHD